MMRIEYCIAPSEKLEALQAISKPRGFENAVLWVFSTLMAIGGVASLTSDQMYESWSIQLSRGLLCLSFSLATHPIVRKIARYQSLKKEVFQTQNFNNDRPIALEIEPNDKPDFRYSIHLRYLEK
ncbi:MAG TPA: hypothetical protein IGS17_12125 [Oscillatoriales cyanobacterium M59_W2019_021]|nr:hypothetical protein [Oscillatoriales cyanobacterium M4454_W2019_049]HIK51649.1 hypothetical protein [Oscillatoriales cyanobacterium M59_W2019_021]